MPRFSTFHNKSLDRIDCRLGKRGKALIQASRTQATNLSHSKMHLLDANTQHISAVCLALLCSSLPVHVRWRRRQENATCLVTVIKEQTKQDPWLPSSSRLHLATGSFSGLNPPDPVPHPHPESRVTLQMRGSVYPHLNSNHLLLAGRLWLLLRFPALEHEGCGALWWLCGKPSLHRTNECFLSSCQQRTKPFRHFRDHCLQKSSKQ